MRTITVTGSSEMEVEPNEIILVIGVREYWEEEFDDNYNYYYNNGKNLKTKVPINEIEDSLTNKLLSYGITKEDITISRLGNYWRYYYTKKILVQKQFTISVKQLDLIDKIISEINFKGIEHIQIQDYKNTKTPEHRKTVKIDALKAAKEKAEYLIETYDENIGKVLKIVEINNDLYNPNSYYSSYYYQQRRSNYNSNSEITTNDDDTGFKKIKLRYEMEVTFQIK